MANIDISIIIPFSDYRLDPRYIGSWTQKQSCPPERFEVVVVSDGLRPDLEAKVRGVLRSHDRLIRCEGHNRASRYHRGACAARGRLLFLTEDHCVGDAHCVREVLDFFARHDFDGACIQSRHYSPHRLGLLEQRRFETTFGPDHWKKVFFRGFVIYRKVYFDAGGLLGVYEDFVEVDLSVKLLEARRKFGVIDRTWVTHVNHYRWAGFRDDILNTVRGECQYRADHPTTHCEKYVGRAPEWEQRSSYRPEMVRLECWALWKTLVSWLLQSDLSRGWALWFLLRELVRGLPFTFLPASVRVFQAWQTVAWLGVCWRLGLGHQDYVALWNQISHYGRVAYIVEHLSETVTPLSPAYDYDMKEIDELQLINFHSPEMWEGRTFRWTEPVAIMRCALPRGYYQVTIDTGGIRKEGDGFPCRVFWNRHPIPLTTLRCWEGRLIFSVFESWFRSIDEQHLIILCVPLQAPRDPRRLGLPIFSVRFVPTQCHQAAVPP